MDDRRSSFRSRTLLEGHVIVPGRSSHMGCTVLDLSEAGARLLLDWETPLPPEFEIRIPRRRLSRRATVVWSNGRDVGLKFVDGASPDPSQEVPKLEPAGTGAPDEVARILEEARSRLARVLERPADQVRLRVEIDY